MKLFRFIFVMMICFLLTSLVTSTVAGIGNQRTFLSPLKQFFKCQLGTCPPWKCQDDSAVIHGYCCHCPGSEKDNVPVPCYPDIKCPKDPYPLCSDYEFMMDCCCTGP